MALRPLLFAAVFLGPGVRRDDERVALRALLFAAVFMGPGLRGDDEVVRPVRGRSEPLNQDERR